MARATTAAIAERIDILQRMLLEGSSNSACVAHASREWGVSRRQAYRLLKRAWQRIAEDGRSRSQLLPLLPPLREHLLSPS